MAVPVVGVQRARDLVAAVVDGAAVGSGPVLGVWGPPGAGKSDLLSTATHRTPDVVVLAGAADPGESDVPLALLHQLLAPLDQSGTARGPDPSGSVAGLLRTPSAATADELSAALDRVAARTPLLVVLDDVDQADPASSEVLRRWVERPRAWGLLLAGRVRAVLPPPGSGPPTADEVYLGPLSDVDSRDLVRAVVGPVPAGPEGRRQADMVDDVVRWSAGNPGVLMRLAGAVLTPDVLAEGSTVDVERRRDAALATLWLPGRGVSPPVKRLALLWAAASTYPGPTTGPVVPPELADGTSVDELVTAGLLVRDVDQLSPVHPLLPAAVLELASSDEGRRAHAALAGTTDLDDLRRAWHRALATAGADDEVADDLERAVAAAWPAPTQAAGARMLELAATRSVDPATRASRWVRAAEFWLAAGEPDRAVTLLRRVPQAGAPATARALLLEGRMAIATRTPQEAVDRLLRSAELAHDHDHDVALEALGTAAEVSWWSGWTERSADIVVLTCAAAAGSLLAEVVLGGAAVLADDLPTAGVHLRAALVAGTRAVTARDHHLAGQAALLLGDDVAAYRHLTEAVRRLREDGDVFRLTFDLQLLAAVEAWRGRPDQAQALLTEGRALVQLTGDLRSEAFERSVFAHVEGLQVAGEATAAAADSALRLVTGGGVVFLAGSALWAMGRADLAAGRLAAAVERLREVTDPTATRAHPVAALFAVPDLVEAAVRAGRPELGREALPRFRGWADAGSPWARAVLPRLLALLSPDDAGTGWDTVVDDPDRPFERARTQLLRGEHLRRARHRVRARVDLEQARSTFAELGMVPWAARAATELNATAERARRDPDATSELTQQELVVARLVAGGASNQQVAEQLYLSRKTVESHLHKVYTKLGITSRKQLADSLAPAR